MRSTCLLKQIDISFLDYAIRGLKNQFRDLENQFHSLCGRMLQSQQIY